MNEITTTTSNHLPVIGGFAFRSMTEIESFAILMSKSAIAIPKHLRDQPGACMAIAIQASEWQMSPFAVANKSYSVNDRLGYEAQLINAVILRRAPIHGRFAVAYSGSGSTRKCKVSATLSDGGEVVYESPEISSITTKNSPLWKADPDQQLFYFSSRSLCRRHFPDVLLGIYTRDELEDSEPERNVMPQGNPWKSIETTPEVEAYVEVVAEPVQSDSDAIKELMDTATIKPKEIVNYLESMGFGDGKTRVSQLAPAIHTMILGDWEVIEKAVIALRKPGGAA
jgi:hypothetical protein